MELIITLPQIENIEKLNTLQYNFYYINLALYCVMELNDRLLNEKTEV